MVNTKTLSKTAIHLYKNPLISGSAILFIGSFSANLLSYLFNILIDRFLTVTDYGTYFTLISLIGLVGIFPSAFTQIFAKFAAMYKAQQDEKSMDKLFFMGNRVLVIFASIVLLVLSVSIVAVASFLHIADFTLLFLIFIAIFLSIIVSLPIGFLQGEMRFGTLALVSISTQLFKIIIGFLLLYLGFQLLGAAFALILASTITLILLFFLLRKRFKKIEISKADQSVFLSGFRKYSYQLFLATLGITVLTSIDMIIVKNVLQPVEAGQYAALSLMGRSIYYITAPIYAVFFPLIAQKKERNENIHSTLFLAISIITAGTVLLSFLYFLMPQVILNVFYPAPEYRVLAQYLGPFSLYIIIFSIAMLMNSFLLSIGKSRVYIINLLVAVIFVVLLFTYNKDFYQVIVVLFSTAFFLLLMQISYYLYTLYGKK